MRPVTLRNGLVLIVIAALLPIGSLSIVQALSTLNYSRTLIGNRLVTSALATAARERDPLVISKQVLLTLSKDQAVLSGNAGCSAALKAGLGNIAAIPNVARSDAMGRVQCSALPFDPAISFANEAWWQRGIKAQGFTVSAPVNGRILKRRILVGMQPIQVKDGTNDGAMTVAIDASWLERSMAASELDADAAVAIVDEQGTVVLTSEKRQLPQFNVAFGDAKVADAIARDGVAWMYAVAPLYDNKLFVVYAEPTKHLLATAVKQVRISLLLPIAALLIACLAIWFGTTRLVLQWLESLRTLASQFAKGDFAGNAEKYERAPRELGLLSADLHSMARAIETRDHELQAALDAKTALTHDIHHRVKNNLQIVSSLLNLQAGKISDPAAREALNQTRARIGGLAQIHRLLYEESHDSDHGNVNIASLLNALCVQLRALHRGQSNVQLVCEAASQTVPINNAVPLTLLAVEAVTNAYRHGFPSGQNGRIVVQFMVIDEQATLSVTDDGSGFDVTQKTASMGGQLMEAFAQQLGGVLSVVSTPGNGTVIKLAYPLLHEQAGGGFASDA
ncbi:sensor histidine kinase [Sphingorhabdus sp.]|uniref:sensor histidine kinase n=1 Tax=Sphingorhabdus sp. TaxID=1902408 RepID=UPI0035930065